MILVIIGIAVIGGILLWNASTNTYTDYTHHNAFNAYDEFLYASDDE